MTADPLHAVPVEVAARRAPLDYYLVLSRHDRSESTDVAEGIVVEEFSRHRARRVPSPPVTWSGAAITSPGTCVASAAGSPGAST
ncbi:hypothetical protein O7614_05405 [Micromonospora sp. WMMD961]|uniref:hypothetical protein n=1 Tax=Micromonospora sp. WMMD961 TaxID=3016100 RepID=UPI002417B802|nr:hypothetical protein [Micromonospora sp. WMMD961]MDG4779081.1 hypothetical protein [Micromonospora sp. WMMD961]